MTQEQTSIIETLVLRDLGPPSTPLTERAVEFVLDFAQERTYQEFLSYAEVVDSGVSEVTQNIAWDFFGARYRPGASLGVINPLKVREAEQ